MLDENFWNPKKNRYISSCIKEFIDGEPVFAELDSVKRGELETELFALLQKVKEPIYREVDEEYLREDVSDKIKEWCGKKGEFILSLFSFNEIDCIVSRWQDKLGDAEPYWEVNWEVLRNILEEDYNLSSLEYYSKPKIKEYLEYIFKHGYMPAEALSIKDYFKLKKKGELT